MPAHCQTVEKIHLPILSRCVGVAEVLFLQLAATFDFRMNRVQRVLAQIVAPSHCRPVTPMHTASLSSSTSRPPFVPYIPLWLKAFGWLFGMRPIVIPKSRVAECQKVLYAVSHVEEGFKPPEGNPSGTRLTEDGQLVDKFTDVGLWFGLDFKGKIIATFRIMPQRPFELELYHKVPEKALEGVMEGGRLAILREFRNGPAIALIGMFCAEIRQQSGRPWVCVATDALAEHVYLPVLFQRTGVRFRYDSGGEECELLSWTITSAAMVRLMTAKLLGFKVTKKGGRVVAQSRL